MSFYVKNRKCKMGTKCVVRGSANTSFRNPKIEPNIWQGIFGISVAR
jgi:hypothetical protein